MNIINSNEPALWEQTEINTVRTGKMSWMGEGSEHGDSINLWGDGHTHTLSCGEAKHPAANMMTSKITLTVGESLLLFLNACRMLCQRWHILSSLSFSFCWHGSKHLVMEEKKKGCGITKYWDSKGKYQMFWTKDEPGITQIVVKLLKSPCPSQDTESLQSCPIGHHKN